MPRIGMWMGFHPDLESGDATREMAQHCTA